MFKIVLLLLLFLIPTISLAQLHFTEIMYDAEGSDTNKEFIEIKNSSNNSINLEGYRLFENNGNRRLSAGFGNDFILPANSYGLLVKNPEEFKIFYPNFYGFILKSSFSLKNTVGELIELRDADGNILDALTYNPDSGGKNGDTLSLFNNVWKNGISTPGVKNIEKNINDTSDNISSNTNEGENQKSDTNNSIPKINRSYVEITDMFEGKKKLHAEIDAIKTIMTGAKFELVGRAYGLTGVEIKGVDFLWNLGDGTRDRGQKITHEYYFTGEHLISLIVKSGGFTSPTVKQKITVVAPPIKISQVDFEQNFIEIKNNHNQILNIQDWILMVDGEKFIIPKNTYILENGNIKFSQKNTHLQIKPEYRIFLLYPNHKKFQEYKKPVENLIPTGASISDTELIEVITELIKSEEFNKLGNNESEKITTQTTSNYPVLITNYSQKNSKIVNPEKPLVQKTASNNPVNLPQKTANLKTDFSADNPSQKPVIQPTVLSNQTARILPLKQNPNSFLQIHFIEISFLGFLLFLIVIVFYSRRINPKNLIKEEADEFEITENIIKKTNKTSVE